MSVIEHVDESFLHLHAFGVPDLLPNNRLDWANFHPGCKAAAAAAASSATSKARNTAYCDGMRAWQNSFHAVISKGFGHKRFGPRRERLLRMAELEPDPSLQFACPCSNLLDLAELVEPLLVVRRVLREQFVIQHRRLLAIVRDDEVCRRLMTVPGVGPVVALTYRATVDVPARFRKSKAVGAVFGLTPAQHQSGESKRLGAISKCGDEMMRVMLYEAAQSMLRSKTWSWLKAWAMQIARRRGMKKAIVALARRLAVIMHRIWVDGTEFRWSREQAAAAAA